MALLNPLTELDAVNDMLMSIGQRPVNTLAVSNMLDVSIARTELTKVIRFIQLNGYAFNTDENVTLTPDTNGIVLVPNGCLRIDPSDNDIDFVQRKHPNGSLALYDRTNHTWTISAPVLCRIIWAYDFDALPPAAQAYAVAAAGRVFQQRVVGEPQADRILAERELRAFAALQREERSARDTNIFTNNPNLTRSHRGYRRSI